MSSKSNYWVRQTPETKVQESAQFGNDKVSSLVKQCLMEYIASFLDSKGVNRSFIASAFPSMNIYLSDAEKLNIKSDDPARREIQLTCLYERVKEKLPCILIDDSNVAWRNAGIGKFQKTTLLPNGKTQFWFKVIRDVTVNLIIGANDQTTCSSIRDAVSIMFGELCRFTNGNVLSKEEDDKSSWEVVVNTQPLELGNIERVPTGTGDSSNSFNAFSQGTITCRFEGNFAVEQLATQHTFDNKDREYELVVPSQIKVGETGLVQILHCPPIGMRIMSTNDNIVLLKKVSPTKFKALARNLGKVKIQLIDDRLPEKVNGFYRYKTVQEKEIEVTL